MLGLAASQGENDGIEDVFAGLGVAALAILALVGVAIGWLAGALTGRGKVLYALIGAAAALAMPFVLAALGVTVLAAGGVLLVVGAVGAAVVVAVVRGASGRG